ncbi:MAG: glycosyltransferase family 4 protein, partial [Candidatus Omnitrophica bacterium]|nr:glycosyltransferase family 4 protein [Candidatus Omnitrophota bacterium]
CFYPDPVGGSEIYVKALSQGLRQRGIEVLVVVPGQGSSACVEDGLPVRRFPVSNDPVRLRDLYGHRDPEAAKGFGRLLDQERPDLLHLHALGPGLSLDTVREAKRRGIPVVFTYHTPAVSCQRGTLLRWGEVACDGLLRSSRCARCTLHGLGMHPAMACLAGSSPILAGRLLEAVGLSGGLWTALQMTCLTRLRHRSLRAIFAEVDHVVAIAQWIQDLLVRNGVSPEKITLCRNGLCHSENPPATPRPDSRGGNGELKIAFVGRIDPVKGLHVLIQSIRSAPDLKVGLDIYGAAQRGTEAPYDRRIRSLAQGDRRIRLCPAVPHAEVVSVLRGYDALAMPSQWLESSPLVVLEAFAAGVPVIGSNLGGIAEWVQHGVNGLLVEAASAEAWSGVLRRLSEEKTLLKSLRGGVCPPKTMSEVTEEMILLYERICRRWE